MTFRLLCDAIPFCYGPAAALETLICPLSSSAKVSLEIEVLASGSSGEFLKRSKLPFRLLPVDSERLEDLATLDLYRYDAFLSVCNPISLQVAQSFGLPVAYLDFLLWMHSGPPGCHFQADLYLAENYPGTAEWVQRRGREIPRLSVVPPLVQTISWKDKKGMLLVGLGGMYSRLTIPGVNTNYAVYVVQGLLAALEPRRFEKVVIAGPQGLLPIIKPFLRKSSRVEFLSLSHSQFLNTLAECEAFLSHPGLYAPFEAMLSGVPTGFLPPSNYTQLLQLRHFRNCGLAEFSFSWDDLDRQKIPSDLPESEGITAVLREIGQAEHSDEASAVFHASLSSYLSLDSSRLEDLGAQQRTIASLFSGEGAQLATSYLESWLQGLSHRTLSGGRERACLI